MDLRKDVLDDAVRFILDNDDMVETALRDGSEWDRNDIRDLDQNFHEEIVDRGYSLMDAAYIIEHCDDVEEDSGLWENQQPEDALSIKAAYSYANDVWSKLEELFNEMKQNYDDNMDEYEDQDDDENREAAIKTTWEQFRDEYVSKPSPIKPGSDNERLMLERWLRLNENAEWWGGYPLGGSYIDARVGSGHGLPNIKDYVDFDHVVAKALPHMAGKYREDVRAYYKETFNKEA